MRQESLKIFFWEINEPRFMILLTYYTIVKLQK